MATIKSLPPEVQKIIRGWNAKGGRNGSHESKVKAGKASAAARKKKWAELKKQQQQSQQQTKS